MRSDEWSDLDASARGRVEVARDALVAAVGGGDPLNFDEDHIALAVVRALFPGEERCGPDCGVTHAHYTV
ncbi:MAG: hypothetical protein JWM87_759 [Candidatus Eremiobacteraeota bacterium]|nr:hypothetical protein [Candidatus Eremiobacteraeota bacterium]